ncbi:MAG: NUDIX hydrolase [Candidatus Heimdallarchaeaceae archaeon]
MDIIQKLKVNLEPLILANNYKFEKNLRRAAVLVPIFFNDFSLLLTKRTENVGIHRGQISFPGGKQEKFDKNLISTVFRETKEEVGIGKKQIELLGLLQPRVSTSKILVFPFVGLINSNPKIVIDPNEVKEYFFAKIKDLADSSNFKYGKFNEKKHFYYDIKQYKIWGLTAEFIRDLLKRF